MGHDDMHIDTFTLANRTYRSRLLVGTGKYKDMAETKAVVEVSGAEIITVALRRLAIPTAGQNGPDPATRAGMSSLQETLDPSHYTYLPNSAGCYTAEEAVRTLRLARELGGWALVKLEVIGDKTTLLPHMPETLKAAEILVKDGFHVMAYSDDDAAMAKRLEDIGCAAVMPLAAPIGSGQGLLRPDNIRRIVGQARVPILVDAGIGTPSDAVLAMELGCDGVLLNSALAHAKEPVKMAEAMKHAVIAGRLAYKAGRMPKRMAEASSPKEGVI